MSGKKTFGTPVAFATQSAVDRLTAVYGSEKRQMRITSSDGIAKKKERSKKSDLEVIASIYAESQPRKMPTADQMVRLGLVKARDELVNKDVEAYLKAKGAKDFKTVKKLAALDTVVPYIKANEAIWAFDESVRTRKNAEFKAQADAQNEVKAQNLASTRASVTTARKARQQARMDEAVRRQIVAEEAEKAKEDAKLASLVEAMNMAWRV